MREIKFKVFFDGAIHSLSKAMKHGLVGVQFDREDGFNLEPYYDDVEVMQYTGLTDKNGVEIFEGDVLAVSNIDMRKAFNNFIVSYSDSWSRFIATSVQGSDKVDDLSDLFDCYGPEGPYVVIGNIHQNKDLL